MLFQPYNYSLSGQLQNNLIVSPIQAHTSSYCAAQTSNFNTEFNTGFSRLSRLSENGMIRTQQRLAADPTYKGGRSIGVKNAWRWEKFDVQMGGGGSENWMAAYKDEILETGKIKGAQGHHARNVAHHPEDQANSNNIIIYRDEKEHRIKGHNGDFHNESDMPMVDRQKMVRRTNTKRVVKNETIGAGIAAIIGFGTAASMSMIIELSKNGVSYESLKEASKLAIQNGFMGAGFGTVSYAIYRGVEVAVDYTIKKYAIQLSEKGLKGVKGGVAGGLIIAGTSIYNYVQMRNEGYSVQDSLFETGKQAAYPTATLALSLYFSGPIGVGIGILSTLGYMGYCYLNEHWDQKLMEELLILQLDLMIERLSPKAAYSLPQINN